MKRLYRKIVYSLMLCVLPAIGLYAPCGCGAAEKKTEKLNMWVTGAMILLQTDRKQEEPDESVNKSTINLDARENAVTEETGGNPLDNYAETVIITVFEDHYLYENHEISFEELITLLNRLEEGDIITIYDENATWNAYQKLISALNERNILYISGYLDESKKEPCTGFFFGEYHFCLH